MTTAPASRQEANDKTKAQPSQEIDYLAFEGKKNKPNQNKNPFKLTHWLLQVEIKN